MATPESHFNPAALQFCYMSALAVAHAQALMLAHLGAGVDSRALLDEVQAEAARSASKRTES